MLTTTHFLLIILPLLGAVVFTRAAVTALMGLLAAFSLGCARDGSGTSSSTSGNSNGGSTGNPIKPNTPEDKPVVVCYMVAAPASMFTNPEWQDNQDLNDWATAERELLDYSYLRKPKSEKMAQLVNAADNACSSAKRVVKSGILSAKVYEIASEIMGEWHKSLATGQGGVLCYKSMLPDPIVVDSGALIWQLDGLVRDGKMNSETANQVRSSLRSRLAKDLSASDTEQLMALLKGLLGIL